MKFLKNSISEKIRHIRHIFSHKRTDLGFHKLRDFHSAHLHRNVKINIYLPPAYHNSPNSTYPLLLVNDGQDMQAIQMAETLHNLYHANRLRRIVVAAIHAGDRGQEYGTAGIPDYKNRGSKAAAYMGFITDELLPYLRSHYRLTHSVEETAFAGFSLGGLSAIDIVWNNPQLFGAAGVFSGSFWWRSEPVRDDDPDADRIMHEVIANSEARSGMRFWLQTGTRDETDDRNNNGIIDSIDDTMDLIAELKNHGYQMGRDIRYVEVEGGEHNQWTWRRVMSDFLQWAFGKG